MLGSTLASGVISAPATAASPQPIPKVKRRTRLLSMPSPCASVLVHDHGARVEAEPGAGKKRGKQSADENGNRDEK